MKHSDYFNFEFPMLPYWNSAYGEHGPKLTYKGERLSGNWYLKYVLKGNSPALVPKKSWLEPGRRFLDLLLKNDPDFTDHLYKTYTAVIPFTEKLEKMSSEDMQSGHIRDRKEYYDEYIRTWVPVISFGYPLDMALDEYLKTHPIDLSSAPVFGHSFIREEEIDLKKIANESDEKKREEMLREHSHMYSYVLSNYTGYHPATIEYFRDRLEAAKNKTIAQETVISMRKPENLAEWISFATYIRDVRKKCNMIYNAMSDRYLQAECKRLGLPYEDAVMLLPEEFEVQKIKGAEGWRRFNGVRYMEVTTNGQIDLDESVWNSLVTEKEGDEVHGSIASKGATSKTTGTVRIVFGAPDFHKVQKGDIIVTSMTRPDFAPILHNAAAIITNEGGITCHAAIISREMKIPCIIATGNATKVLKDGDRVEVDANKGIIKILT